MRLITSRTLADQLDITMRTLSRWRESGRLGPAPITKDGHIRFDGDEVDAWIAAGTPRREQWAQTWVLSRIQRQRRETAVARAAT